MYIGQWKDRYIEK